MSWIPARMKKIQFKMKALECSQDFSHYKSMGIFPDAQGQLTPQSLVLGPIWPHFELVRDVMDVLVTCKYEKDPIKNEGATVVTTLYSNFSDAQGQITLVLVSLSGRNSNSSKLEGARVDTTFSPLQPYGSYPLPWTPEFRSDLAQNLMQPFPHPNDGSDKNSLRLAHWLQKYSSLKMFTDGRTDGRRIDRYTIS